MGILRHEKQYSEELECLLSPIEAHHEWLKGNLKNKSAFTCKNPECSATFTCVNMDKISQERVNRIHFRLTGKHNIPGCNLDEENVEGIKKKELDDEQGTRDLEHGIDFLILTSTPKPSKGVKKHEEDEAEKIEKKKRAIKDPYRENSRDSRYSTILPIVINFLEYESNNALDTYKVNNQGKLITYNEMFFELKDMKYDYEINDNRIFHGRSKIYRVKGGYRLEFQCMFNHRGLIQKPSIYISDKAIETGFKHKIRGNALKELAKSGEEFHGFVYGKFGVNEVNIDNEKRYFLVIRFPKDSKDINKRMETINLFDFKNLL